MATGGRFGKYGDLKRKALIRRGRSTGADRARCLVAVERPIHKPYQDKDPSAPNTVWKRKRKANPKTSGGSDAT